MTPTDTPLPAEAGLREAAEGLLQWAALYDGEPDDFVVATWVFGDRAHSDLTLGEFRALRTALAKADAILALSVSIPVDRWRPIESAPKDGTWIITLSPESIQNSDGPGPKPFVSTARWVTEVREYWQSSGPRKQELVTEDASHWSDWELPTHWRPLPAPTAAPEGGGV